MLGKSIAATDKHGDYNGQNVLAQLLQLFEAAVIPREAYGVRRLAGAVEYG